MYTKIILLSIISFVCVQSANGDAALIDDICSKSGFASYCHALFDLDPRSANADAHQLVLIALQAAEIKAQTTITENIASLWNVITDPVGRERLGVCQSDYIRAVGEFKNSFQSADKNAYADASDWMRKALFDITDCQSVYRRKDPIAESPISSINVEIILNMGSVLATAIAVASGQ